MLDLTGLPKLYEEQFKNQSEFAQKLGITQSYLSLLVNNKRRLNEPLMAQMAQSLGLSLAQFVAALEKNMTESRVEGLTA